MQPMSGTTHTNPGRGPKETSAAEATTPIATENLPLGWQKAIVGILLLHVLAVFSEPFLFFSRSDVQPAPDAAWLRSLFRPYTQTLFLDHGYFFFAPNPGPGHLLRIASSDDPLPQNPDDRRPTPLAEIRQLDGSDVQEQILPDRRVHSPRLLYHRYFMFSEFYFARYAPRQVAIELEKDSDFVARWKGDRLIYTELQQSLHRYVRNRTQHNYVRFDRLERTLPDRNTILRENVRLTDNRWLVVLPETMDLPSDRPERNTPRFDELPPPSQLSP